MTSTAQASELGTGTWVIDPMHSAIAFVVRHLTVAKVRGNFTSFGGELRISDELESCSVSATVDVESLTTRQSDRDAHLRSPDFFDAATYPHISYRSTDVRRESDGVYLVSGELTIRDVTRPIELRVEANGVTPDPMGTSRAGFSATGAFNRRDFGIVFDMPMGGPGFVIGDQIKVELDVAAVLQAGEGG